MSLVPQFLASLHRLRYASPAGPSSLLTRTAVAVADTIPGVEGSAICLSRQFGMRVPIATSDDHSALAEQLEFTAGFGPGLQARRSGQPVLAGANLARRYTAFHDGLVTRTAFRAMLAVPLGDDGEDPPAVLLLFYAAARLLDQSSPSSLTDIMELALLVGQAVTIRAGDAVNVGSELPPQLDQLHARRRIAVEAAVGLIKVSEKVPALDALDILRGHAYARGRLVDDTAHDLLTKVLHVEAFH